MYSKFFSKKNIIHLKSLKRVATLFIYLACTNSFANFILECKTTKILKMGAGIPPQPIGGVFQFRTAGSQAWSDPFHTSLLFQRVKAEPTPQGGDRALFSAKGFNMPEATIFFEVSKNNNITITASQANTSIFATCTDITNQVRKNNQDAAQKAQAEQFSQQQLENGIGWYVSRLGGDGKSLETTLDQYRDKIYSEPRLAVMRSANETRSGSNHYLMIGPYASKAEAEIALSRTKKEIYYATLIKIGERQLRGNSYSDNVHIIIQKTFKAEISNNNDSPKVNESAIILNKINLINDDYFMILASLVTYADMKILAQPDAIYTQFRNFSDNILSASDKTGIFIRYSNEKNRVGNLIDKNIKSMDRADYEKWIQSQVNNNVDRFNELNKQRNLLIAQYNEALKK
jgi:hypothetical protein